MSFGISKKKIKKKGRQEKQLEFYSMKISTA
jgi:hypothetical protein